jgi:antitoxin (DNA-binding transcriptional repressor) of toxin-antitoxin stability system
MVAFEIKSRLQRARMLANELSRALWSGWRAGRRAGCILKTWQQRVIHISDAEAASDFASLLERVRAGSEFVIERDARPVAVLRSVAPEPSIEQAFAAIARDVPDEHWDRVPADLSKNVDHYLYGASKTSS